MYSGSAKRDQGKLSKGGQKRDREGGGGEGAMQYKVRDKQTSPCLLLFIILSNVYLQYSLFRGLSHLGHYPLWEAPEVNFLILRGATEVIRPL